MFPPLPQTISASGYGAHLLRLIELCHLRLVNGEIEDENVFVHSSFL